MTELTTYPRQDFYRSELAAAIAADDTEVSVATAPSFTLSSGSLYAQIDPEGQGEIAEVTAISGTTLTLTRGVAKYEGGPSTAAAHAGGTTIIFANNWKLFDDIKTAIASKANKAGDTFTGLIQFSGTDHAGIKFISLTTAQRTALSASDGMVVYDTDIGENYQYVGGAWSAVSAGSTQPNASETVAGKVELADAGERAAGTSVGGTGARLIPTNDALVKTSSGAADENKIPVLNASGQMAAGFVDLSSVPAKTLWTAKGSLLGASGASTPVERAVGTDGYALVADSAESSGLNWADVAPKINLGQSTRGAGVASGTQNIAHGLGIAPKFILFNAVSSTNANIHSNGGMDDDEDCACTYGYENSGTIVGSNDATNCINIADNNQSDVQKATVSAVDATNFTLTWTRVGSGEAVSFTWIAYA